MAQPITDYAAFFDGARQAVKELEQLRQKQDQLEDDEKKLEKSLQARQRMVAETISVTLKQRTEEISKSYDAEISKLQDQLKKVRAKREKAKNQGVKERIEEDTAPLEKENQDLAARMKTLFRSNHVPGYCRNGYYYALYFTKGFKEAGWLLLTLLVCFLAVPCGIYFLIPERKSLYLIFIYVAVIFIFGGLYVVIGNRTKLKYMDVLKEGRTIRNKIRSNHKEMKVIAKTIRRDKNESVYNLEKFDDEIAQLSQDMDQVTKKKKDALNTFETVTRTIISDEIAGNHKEELDQMQADLEETTESLRTMRNLIKETALSMTDHYEVYVGKDFMTEERLNALDRIIKSGSASNISEAIVVYKSGNYEDGNFKITETGTSGVNTSEYSAPAGSSSAGMENDTEVQNDSSGGTHV